MSIQIPEIISVKELAEKLDQPVTEVIKKLVSFGVLASINDDLDFDTASIITDEFGLQVSPLTSPTLPLSPAGKKGEERESRGLENRPPVVAIMGHVDHGKTTLLDYIRKTKVTETEAGGITQHISAYQIEIKERKITFIDTPGHSAFEATRKHGASITDLVILVVAADEGIKPQTIEVINLANLSKVPIIVAMNKIDKPEADLEKVKRQLAELNLTPEEWGGQTIMVPIAAKTGEGVDRLLEMIFLVTDVNQLQANPESPGYGAIIESHVTPGIGAQATVLLQNGSLALGNYFVCGDIHGKVKTLLDGRMKKAVKISPGDPGLISGLSGLPEFAARFNVVSSEKEAKTMAKNNQRRKSVKTIKSQDLGQVDQATEQREGKIFYKVVLKADTEGSIEAIRQSLGELENEDVGINIISSAVGEINQSDIKLARAAKASIIGFNVRLSASIQKLAQNENVKVESYTIIYDLLDFIEDILRRLMPIVKIEVEEAEVEILAVFNQNKKNFIVGGIVKSGQLARGLCQLKRGNRLLARGEIVGLKKGKDEAKAIKSGTECGIELNFKETIAEDFNQEIKVGDLLIQYIIQEQQKSYHKK